MEGKEPRLVISRVVNENFKSYAGKIELGIFHKNFTAIVGPNGSGKSNVIDALLFVFGYRARKIRSKKLSVLIHNSEGHKDAQSCTVSIYFHKIIDMLNDGYEVVAGSEFVVSRTAYKDNSSVYHLNGKKVLFREVATLLRGHGIDLDHNRFLILQGEVEHIALLRPKAQTENDDGMLEFLEDIIGSSQFKEPIEQLSKRVEELNEARREKLNRVRVIEKEKDELEDAKKEAEEFLAMKCDVAKKQLTLYQRYIYECNLQWAKSKEKKEDIDAKLLELRSNFTTFKGALNDKIEQHKKGLKGYDKLVAKKDKYKTAMTSCEQRDIKSRQALKNVKANLKKSQKIIEKEKEKLKELEGVPVKYMREMEQLDEKIKSLEVQKSKEEDVLSQVLANLRSSTKDLQAEKEEHEIKLVPLKQAVNDSGSKLDMVKAELELYEEQCNGVSKKLQEATSSLKKINEDKEARESELVSLQEAFAAKKKQLTKAEQDMASITTKEESLSKHLKNVRLQVDEAKSALQAQQNRGQLLNSLMKQCEQGAIKGIHGRLGDLGTIDEKYDVAISTACPALDDVVVDTMQTAVQCVEFLKKHNLGSATFIALDKMERWRNVSKKTVSIPENLPRLFDLVKIKEQKFTTAFYYSLRDTAVAKDLNQATRVGLQGKARYRVVTLDGAVINQSGTMSGGGKRVLKGRMSSSPLTNVSPQQLTEMEQTLSREASSHKKCVEEKNQLATLIQDVKNEIDRIEKDVQRHEMDIQLLLEQAKAKKDQISDLEKKKNSTKVDLQHLNKLKQQVKSLQEDYDKATNAASKVEAKIKRLQDKILEVGGSKVQEHQAKVDMISKEIETHLDTITKAKVTIKTAERNNKKCTEKIHNLEQEIEKNEQKVVEIKDELSSLETEAKEIIAEQEGIVEEIKKIEAELLEVKDEILKCEEEQQKLNDQILDHQHEQEKYVTVMKENQQKIKYYNSEMKKLQLPESEKVQLKDEELAIVDREAIEYDITTLEEKLKTMQPNMSAIAEYKQKEEQYLQRAKELDDATNSRDVARKEFDDLRKQRLDCFMAGFSVITTKLKEMYQMITLGGDAELELVDSLDPFSEGIVFSVRPPQKSWKNISNLSGGEKTLSSLALVFALHHYKPSPLYVMDEIDAALDFKNVSIVANYIKERTKNAQFIIISLRNNMFELADCLVGIYKTEDSTKTVTVHPTKISRVAAAAAAGRQPLSEKNL